VKCKKYQGAMGGERQCDCGAFECKTQRLTIRIAFEAHPIETAPKDRQIMLLKETGLWYLGFWNKFSKAWTTMDLCTIAAPVRWAEIADMAPKEGV
jgi:hypothetical protein